MQYLIGTALLMRDLFHNFMDFKEAFDSLTCKPVAGPQKLQQRKDWFKPFGHYFYENSTSAVLLNTQLWEFFKTTAGVQQECLLSSILFNLLLEKIMQEMLHDQNTSISTDGKPICNLRFADDTDLMKGNNGELRDLTNRFVDRAQARGSQYKKDQGHDQKH